MTLCICIIGNLTSFFKYVTPLLPFFKGNFLALGLKICYQSAVELPDLYVPYFS